MEYPALIPILTGPNSPIMEEGCPFCLNYFYLADIDIHLTQCQFKPKNNHSNSPLPVCFESEDDQDNRPHSPLPVDDDSDVWATMRSDDEDDFMLSDTMPEGRNINEVLDVVAPVVYDFSNFEGYFDSDSCSSPLDRFGPEFVDSKILPTDSVATQSPTKEDFIDNECTGVPFLSDPQKCIQQKQASTDIANPLSFESVQTQESDIASSPPSILTKSNKLSLVTRVGDNSSISSCPLDVTSSSNHSSLYCQKDIPPIGSWNDTNMSNMSYASRSPPTSIHHSSFRPRRSRSRPGCSCSLSPVEKSHSKGSRLSNRGIRSTDAKHRKSKSCDSNSSTSSCPRAYKRCRTGSRTRSHSSDRTRSPTRYTYDKSRTRLDHRYTRSRSKSYDRYKGSRSKSYDRYKGSCSRYRSRSYDSYTGSSSTSSSSDRYTRSRSRSHRRYHTRSRSRSHRRYHTRSRSRSHRRYHTRSRSRSRSSSYNGYRKTHTKSHSRYGRNYRPTSRNRSRTRSRSCQSTCNRSRCTRSLCSSSRKRFRGNSLSSDLSYESETSFSFQSSSRIHPGSKEIQSSHPHEIYHSNLKGINHSSGDYSLLNPNKTSQGLNIAHSNSLHPHSCAHYNYFPKNEIGISYSQCRYETTQVHKLKYRGLSTYKRMYDTHVPPMYAYRNNVHYPPHYQSVHHQYIPQLLNSNKGTSSYQNCDPNRFANQLSTVKINQDIGSKRLASKKKGHSTWLNTKMKKITRYYHHNPVIPGSSNSTSTITHSVVNYNEKDQPNFVTDPTTMESKSKAMIISSSMSLPKQFPQGNELDENLTSESTKEKTIEQSEQVITMCQTSELKNPPNPIGGKKSPNLISKGMNPNPERRKCYVVKVSGNISIVKPPTYLLLERKFVCQICDLHCLAHLFSEHFISHMKAECILCEKSMLASVLTTHLTTDHFPANHALKSCPVCEDTNKNTISSAFKLNRHILTIHYRLSCPVCSCILGLFNFITHVDKCTKKIETNHYPYLKNQEQSAQLLSNLNSHL